MVRLFSVHGKKKGAYEDHICFYQLAAFFQGSHVGYANPSNGVHHEAELFDFIKSQWDMPELMAHIKSPDDFTGVGQKAIVMDLSRYSAWEIFNHFSLARYLTPEFPGFGGVFAEVLQQWDVNPTQAFILTNFFSAGRYWNSNHQFFAPNPYRRVIGNLEPIESLDYFRRKWPKFPVVAEQRNRGWMDFPYWDQKSSPKWLNHYRDSMKGVELVETSNLNEITKSEKTMKTLFPNTWRKVFKLQ